VEALALTTAALVASTAPFAAAAKDRFEDFTAGIHISEVLQFPSSDPACQPHGSDSAALGFINGSGLASVIGAFTFESVDCVRSENVFFQPPFEFSSTTFKLTDASGHQIVASYGGTATLEPTGLLVLRGSFTFTGGTGKYSKVKGGGTLLGVENIATNPATGFVTLHRGIACRDGRSRSCQGSAWPLR
jgi:hypothetical protein